MLTTYYWIENKKLVYNSDGTLRSNTTNPFFTKVSLWTDNWRESVDSGSFVPGEFRINPYRIGAAGCEATNSVIEMTTTIGTTKYVYSYIGMVSKLVGRCYYIDPTDLPGYVQGMVLQKTYAKLGSSVLELGVELGEFRETVAMLKSPLKGLRDFFLRNRERNLRQFNEILSMSPKKRISSARLLKESGKTAADTWLEIRYGLRPLISSITAIATEVMRKEAMFDASRIKVVRSSWKKESHTANTRTIPAIKPNWRAVLSEKGYTDNQVRACLFYKMDKEASLARKMGISPVFFPEIMWELTRLSFVVDWIFSVGPWLGTLRINPGYTILGNTVSVKQVFEGEITITDFYDTTEAWDCTSKNGNQTLLHHNKSYDRQIDVDLPSTPVFRGTGGLSLAKLIDSLALITQPLLRKMKR